MVIAPVAGVPPNKSAAASARKCADRCETGPGPGYRLPRSGEGVGDPAGGRTIRAQIGR